MHTNAVKLRETRWSVGNSGAGGTEARGKTRENCDRYDRCNFETLRFHKNALTSFDLFENS